MGLGVRFGKYLRDVVVMLGLGWVFIMYVFLFGRRICIGGERVLDL